jgi:hypothetical protein
MPPLLYTISSFTASIVAQMPAPSSEHLLAFILCVAAVAVFLKNVLDLWKTHLSPAPQKPDPESIKSQFDALDRRLCELEASDTRWRDALDERMRNMEMASTRHTALLETVLSRLERHN